MAATPPLSELDPLLASLNELKPPGANKSKIGVITSICVKNIQAEQSIVQSFYRALKKAPPTHKLGALYVIDSVIRQWTERAKKAGEDINIEGRGEPGTYAAAMKRVAELMPALLDNTVKVIPVEQKPKLNNLVDIWDRSKFFPTKVIAEFTARLSEAAAASTSQVNGSAATPHEQQQQQQQQTLEKFKSAIPTRPTQTPVGWPPQHLHDQGLVVGKGNVQSTNATQSRPSAAPSSAAAAAAASSQQQQSHHPAQPPAASAADVNSILAALASAAPRAAPPPPPQPSSQQQQQQQAPPPNPPPSLPGNLAALLAQSGLAPPPSHPIHSATPSFGGQQTHMQQFGGAAFPQQFPGFPPQPPPSIPQHYGQAPPPPPQQQLAPQQDLLGPLRGILPQNILNDHQKLMQALNLLQELQSGGLPMEQWGPVIQAFSEQTSNQPSGAPGHNAYDMYNRGRDRSRSPDRDGRGRGSPVYGNYDEIAARRHGDGNGQNGRDRARGYRQRSPMRDSPGPAGSRAMNGNSMQPKVILFESSLQPDSIKVLSRTLFVGGASGTQQDIQSLFERFGRVQSCIANRDKRHAFVKMTTRQYALNAKAGMEALQAANDRDTMGVARQTKWGVGFGPRECCDYARGESIIPISKLTEADVKWLLSAEYGGTGGKELQGGMVLEEPDIEIGAGVSSKAMSKRVVPDGGPPKRGGREERERDRGGRRPGQDRERDRFRQGREDVQMSGMPMESYGYTRPEPVAVATPPAVPGFGFTLPGR